MLAKHLVLSKYAKFSLNMDIRSMLFMLGDFLRHINVFVVIEVNLSFEKY